MNGERVDTAAESDRRTATTASDAQERLGEVVAVVVEVAAEAGEAGTYTYDMGRALTEVVTKAGARMAAEAEIRGFAGGWREAVGHAEARR